MIFQDLLFTLRNLRNNKLLAVINVVGLAIGMTACLVIFLIASYEMSVDKHIPDRDRIYRIYSSFSGAFTSINPGVPTAIGPTVRDHFSGIESVTTFHTFDGDVEIPFEGSGVKKMGNYDKVAIVDPGYFHVFSHYRWLQGDASSSLSEPFRVVLTEDRVRAYFGNVDPAAVIGKEIIYRDSLSVTVSGVVASPEHPTDLFFTDFISFNTIEKSWLNGEFIQLDNWESTNSSSQLFLKVLPGTTREDIERQLPLILEISKEKSPNDNVTNTPQLQAFADMHFDSRVGIFDRSRKIVSSATIDILIAVAVVLLIIGIINFVNLETAQASRRAKEVGVRKVLGSSRSRLIRQFLLESFVLCAISLLISFGLAGLSIRWFDEFIPAGMTFDITDPLVWIFFGCCLVTVTILSGIYPAFVLSSYQPAWALKNISRSGSGTTRSSSVRETLTVFQFAVAQVLIIGTVVIGAQIKFMLNKELGFKTDAIVNITTPWFENREKARILASELQQLPEAEAISQYYSPPSYFGYSSSVWEFDNGEEVLRHNVHIKRGDTSYLRLFGIELLAGRNFRPLDPVEECVINETYMRLMGFDDPHEALGKVVNNEYTVVGVVRDFHTMSLHHRIEPTAVYYANGGPTIGVKLASAADMAAVLEKMEGIHKKLYPDEDFNYTFMDDALDRMYRSERRTAKLTNTATVVAILISCLGLFGLSTFTVLQRTKEIGIRKVLGATVNSILLLLSGNFLKLVVIAFLIAAPVAWYLAEQWLMDFAYRMELGIWIFAASVLVSLLLALATISLRTLSAARANPVDTLRYE